MLGVVVAPRSWNPIPRRRAESGGSPDGWLRIGRLSAGRSETLVTVAKLLRMRRDGYKACTIAAEPDTKNRYCL